MNTVNIQIIKNEVDVQLINNTVDMKLVNVRTVQFGFNGMQMYEEVELIGEESDN